MSDTPLEIVIIDRDAAHYCAQITAACPGVVVHAGEAAADVLPHCGAARALVGLAQAITPALVAATPHLAWVQALTTGIDPLLTLGLSRAVTVTSARGIHGPQMAEIAFLQMLALARDFPRMLANQHAAIWERWPQPLLLDKTVVLVGVGAISEDLAMRCKAFGMRVVGVSSTRTQAPGFDRIRPRTQLIDAAGEADFLIALVPYAPDTHHMIDGAVLDALQRHAIFLNIARGPVVDEAALIERLARRAFAGAGLDVFEIEPLPADNPLWRMDNVIVTPHIGGMSDIYATQVLPLVLHNIEAFRAGRITDMRNIVHLPA